MDLANLISTNALVIVVIVLAVLILRRLRDWEEPEPPPADLESWTKAELIDHIRNG